MGGGDQKSIVVCGLKGSGKTVYGEDVARKYGRRCLVVDTVHDFKTGAAYYVWRPEKPHTPETLAVLLKNIASGKKSNQPGNIIDMLVIDEGNRYAPGGGAKLHPVIAEFNDQMRHPPYSCSALWITRRPVQLHPDIIGLADRVLVYHLSGVRDVNYLNDLCYGLGTQATLLPDYYYLEYQSGRFELKHPIVYVK